MFHHRIILLLIVVLFLGACRINFVHRPRRVYRKPVVYLYPQCDTTVTVKLQINGTLVYSEPDYGQGWEVIAHPDGTITDPAYVQTYPYLYWEASTGNNYSFK